MAEELQERDIDAFIDEVWEDVVADITSLVRIESVEDLEHAEPGKPFGPKPYEALAKGLEIAERLGLEAHNCEGYIGYADLPGVSSKQIATIAHTDIVPVGIGWTVPPLDVTRRDGCLLGRGVQDDKGAFVLSLYAAKFFVDQVSRTGQKLPYTIRCIVGTNEETGMEDVDWYLEHFDAPDFLFTPDADFPLICGEKGIFHGEFVSKEPVLEQGGWLLSAQAGTVANAIPGLAEAVLLADAAPSLEGTEGFELESLDGGQVRLSAHGIGGHAAFPPGTINAIGKLTKLLAAAGLLEGDSALSSFLGMVNLLANTTDGEPLGIASSDEVFGALTMNAGVLRTLPDGRMSISIDVRYPTSITIEQITDTFKALAERHGCEFKEIINKTPFYMDPSLPAIQALLSAYRDYVDADAEPFVIGGGTYARHFPRACAFGPNVPTEERPDWLGIEHGPDEGMTEAGLKRALKLYIVGISRLMDIEL